VAAAVGAQEPGAVAVPETVAAVPSSAGTFDPAVATAAYLARLTPEARARSDAYFEGGYWLQLWNFLAGAAVAALLLFTRWSARMRDLVERITRHKPLQTALYWVMYLVVTTVVTFPLTVYQGFVREHAYGLATQNFGGWMGDQLKGLVLGAVLGGAALMLIYGVVRRAPRTWWAWGSGVGIAFLAFVLVIAPVFLAPVFNTYKPLDDAAVRGPILSLARANGIPANDVFVFDASRQTTRISANVSGFLGTERISLNDNLLNRSSLAEIEAVMAHEMGHYVLNHTWTLLGGFGLMLVAAFAFLHRSFARCVERWGGDWGLRDVGDVAGLPLAVFLLSVFFLVATPITNTLIRTHEVEADLYGLNAARQPDGFAEAALKLAEYRKLSPGPLEELLFFDHPSGRSRISMAMRWKAENLPQETAAPPVEPAR
jgi:STE24 endopeptidase